MQRGTTWLVLISTALVVAAVGVWADDIIGVFLTHRPARLTSAYLLPTQAEPLFNEAVVQEHDIHLIHRAADIDFLLSPGNRIDVLYIHPRFLEEVEATWLHEQYLNGTFIVALDTPMRDLAHKLGIPSPMRDQRDPRAPHYVSALYTYFTNNGSTTGAYTNGVFDIRHLPDVLVEKVEDLQAKLP